jgi:hypothetical protein
MLVQVLHFLFSLANDFSVGLMAALAVIWVVALGCYIVQKAIAHRRAEASRRAAIQSENVVSIDSFDSDLVAKAQARI